MSAVAIDPSHLPPASTAERLFQRRVPLLRRRIAVIAGKSRE